MRKHYFAAGGSIVACLLFSLIRPVSAQITLSESLDIPGFQVVGGEITALAAADLDGDRKPESAVGFGALGRVQLFPMVGNKSSYATSIEVGSNGITDICFRDINKDNQPDAIIAAGNQVFVAINGSTPGHLQFAEPVAFELPFTAKSLVLGDFNMLGNPEIAVAGEQSLYILSVSGDESAPVNMETIASFTFKAPVHDIRIADINGDGNIDIAAGTAAGLAIVTNNTAYGATSFTFANPMTIGHDQHVNSLDIADLNGDFMPDIVTGNFPANTISIWINTSTGNTCIFDAPRDFPAMASYQVAIGDFNADGWFDIASIPATQNWPVMELLLQNGDIAGEFDEAVTYTSAGSALCVGDVDGDAKDDIITINKSANALSEFTQAAATFSSYNMTSTAFCNEEGSIQFDWMASGLSANTSFIIERSTDGSIFEQIGSVDADASDATKSFSFTFNEQGFEEACYRIVAESETGNRIAGNVLKVTPCINVVQDFVCVFPNPVDQSMQFTYTVSHEVNMQYMIVDLNMRTHLNSSEMIASGTGSTTVDTKNLPKGSYLFTVKFGNQPPHVCRFEKR